METESSRMGEDFIRSIDELLGSAGKVQMVEVHVHSNTVGKTRQQEGRVGEVMQGAPGEAEDLRC